MTTPNQQGQPDPPGSMPTYGSWSEVQHQSEQDWKDDINSQWDTKFSPVQDGTNFLITLMLKLLAGLLNMVPIVGSTLAEVVNNIANGLNQTNNTAVTAGTTATAAQTTANAAQTTATSANTTAIAANTAASNAANVAAAAQTKADKAYANAVVWNKEFAVSTAGVNLGKNEENLGVLMTVPSNGQNLVGIITSVVYTLKANNGSAVFQLIRRTVAGAESVILTTNVGANQTVIEDNSIDFQFTHLDHVMVNVQSISSGAVLTTLHCHLDCIYVEQS